MIFDNEDNNDNFVLKLVTIQIVPFRTLMVALKDILIETNRKI